MNQVLVVNSIKSLAFCYFLVGELSVILSLRLLMKCGNSFVRFVIVNCMI